MYSTSSKIRVSVHSWPRVFKPALPIKLIAQSPTLVGLSRLLNLSGVLHHLEYLSLIIYHVNFANKNKRACILKWESSPAEVKPLSWILFVLIVCSWAESEDCTKERANCCNSAHYLLTIREAPNGRDIIIGRWPYRIYNCNNRINYCNDNWSG